MSQRLSSPKKSLVKTVVSPKSFTLLVLVIGLSIFLRFFLLGHQSLWFDEGYSLYFSDASTLEETITRIVNARDLNGQPFNDRFMPLYYVVLFLWRRVFGSTEFAVRSLSALSSIASVIITFLIALRLYNRRHSFWSLLLVTFSAYSIYYAQEARNYSFLILLTSVQFFFFSKVLDSDHSNERYFKIAFWITTAISLFGNIMVFIPTVTLCISQIVVGKDMKRWREWWLPTAFFSLPAIFYYLSLPNATNPETIFSNRPGFSTLSNIIFTIYGLIVGTTYGPSMEELRGDDKIQVVLSYWPQLLLFFGIALIIFIAWLKTLFGNRNRFSRYKSSDYLLSSFIIISFFFSLIFMMAVSKIIFLPRHAFYLYVPFALLIPSIFLREEYKPGYGRRIKIVRYAQITVFLLIALNIYAIGNYYFNSNYAKDDYRSAVQYLIENRTNQAQSVLFWGEPRLLEYYGDTLTKDGRRQIIEQVSGKTLAEKVRNLTSSVETVFVLVNREFYWGSEGEVEKQMSDLYTLCSQAHFNYFNVYKFCLKNSELL